MVNTETKLKKKKRSAIWDSNKGSCSEAPCGVTEQNPAEQRAGETPLTGEEHLSLEEAELVMASTISFIQANLQQSTDLSRILNRTVGVKGIDVALIKEPWYRGGCIGGLNIPGYSLFFVNGIDRPPACILRRDEKAWMLAGFSCRDLVAVLIKYNEEGVERRLVVCSAYLPYDSGDPPPSNEFKDLVRYF